MSILEDNARIAEWMGYITKIYNYQDTINPAIKIFMGIEEENPAITIKQGTTERLYQPHKDWNQLMEAVEKWKAKGNGFNLYTSYDGLWNCQIWGHRLDDGSRPLIAAHTDPEMIKSVYKPLFESIKQQKES